MRFLQGTHYTDGFAAQNRYAVSVIVMNRLWVFWTFAQWMSCWISGLKLCLRLVTIWPILTLHRCAATHCAMHNLSLRIAPQDHWIRRLSVSEWPLLLRNRGAMALHSRSKKAATPRRTSSALGKKHVWRHNQTWPHHNDQCVAAPLGP